MKAIRFNRLQSLGNTFYDASRPSTLRDQTWLAWPLSSEREFTVTTREWTLKKKRYLEANLSIIPSLIEKVSRYAVGAGLVPTPLTADAEWNAQNKSDFQHWAENAGLCDAMGQWTFADMQRYACESYFSESEFFAAMVRSSSANIPQVQCFNNADIRYIGASGQGYGSLAPGDYTYVDGVKLNRAGKVVAYSLEYGNGSDFLDLPAENIVALIKKKRPNQYRGISCFCSSANSALDAYDLKALETASAKLHSMLGLTITKNTGPGVGADGISAALSQFLQPAVTNPNGTQSPSNQTIIGENFFSGAMIQHMGQGEKLELLASNRPGPNILAFLDWLYRDVSISSGLPVEIILSMTLGGAASRIALADAQAFFSSIQRKIASVFCQRVYQWYTANRILSKDIRKPNDPDVVNWFSCHWQGPAQITADAGNTAQSDIAALDAGITTLSRLYEEKGQSWQAQLTQRISEIAYAQAECKRLGVPYAMAFPAKPGATAPPTIIDNSGPALSS